jgi:hypothetical protein
VQARVSIPSLAIPRNGKGKHRRTAERDVIELIQELSKAFEDKVIAATLNRLGYTTGPSVTPG